MNDHIPDDLSPAGRDLRAYTDELRPRHPVVRNDRGEWVLLRHDLVREAALDPGRFSSAVSRFLQVPNGMDGAEHTAFRAALDPFLSREAVEAHRPTFERIAADLFAALPRHASVEAVREIGATFAVRAQSAWLGWPADLEPRLLRWIEENYAATRSGELARTAAVAEEFDAIIRSTLDPRRDDATPRDLTGDLLRTKVHGRLLTEAEVVSVLRNWTGGDLGSIALCVGVLMHDLAADESLQAYVRAIETDRELDLAIDELLRRDDPFLSNRRVTTCPVHVGGANLPEGARVKLHWTSANRDDAAFAGPDSFDPEGHAAGNLVYGIGPHACPGRWLATLELRVLLRALVDATTHLDPDPATDAVREVAPVGGWARVPVVLT